MAVELEGVTGISWGQHKAGTLIKLAGVQVKRRKKFKVTTNSKHSLPVSPNLLARDFTVSRSDRVYVGDITYIWTMEGWLHLAVTIDLYSRKVVGWAIGKAFPWAMVRAATLDKGHPGNSQMMNHVSGSGKAYISGVLKR